MSSGDRLRSIFFLLSAWMIIMAFSLTMTLHGCLFVLGSDGSLLTQFVTSDALPSDTGIMFCHPFYYFVPIIFLLSFGCQPCVIPSIPKTVIFERLIDVFVAIPRDSVSPRPEPCSHFTPPRLAAPFTFRSLAAVPSYLLTFGVSPPSPGRQSNRLGLI